MFLLQQGWGMLSHIENYLSEHQNTGIILSPRICDCEQMERYVPIYSTVPNTEILFDPHFYEPRTDLPRILSYPYFQDYDFSTQTFNAQVFCENVINYQVNTLQLDSIILPGRYTNSLTESWLQMHHDFAHIGASIHNKTIYSTVALGPDVILNADNFDNVIDEVINYPVNGVYLVFEHPNGDFLVNQEFLYVLLDGLLSIVLSGKKVIIGYANQQSIILAAAGIDYIASGNYRNVRAFDHLNSTDRDTENMRKGVWYFDGNTFGEYKVPALSLAFRRGLNDFFGPPTLFTHELLNAQVPTDVPWRESDAFGHYLELMHQYCQEVFTRPKNERAQYLLHFFEQRRDINTALSSGVFPFGDRGFNNAVNETLSALNAFIHDKGTILSSL
ncbi:MAG: hypothetical protein WC455_07225 [Dehalococcoidia bacterium]|jgi:hypothetical protein